MARSRRLDEYIRRLGSAARGREADLETVIEKLVEGIVERLSASAGQAPAGLEERLTRIEERLSIIEERLSGLEARGHGDGGVDARRVAEEIARLLVPALASAIRQACRGQAQAGAAGDEPQWLRAVRERLVEKGYITLRELPPEVKARLDTGELRRRGLVVIELGGDTVVATREALEEFQRRLAGLKTGDDYEAESKLGRYGMLFRLLRMEGLLYYAGPGRGWRLSLRA